jgi:ketosteroid isomerase-like protein
MQIHNLSTPTAFLIALLSICFCFGCKQNTPNFIEEPYKEKQVQIAQTIEDIFKVGKAKDLKRLEAYHLNSTKFTKFESGSPVRLNYDENTQGEAAAFSALEEFKYQISELKVDVFDKVGIATFTFAYDAKVQGTSMADTSHCTLVFIETDGQWKITHEHFSKAK